MKPRLNAYAVAPGALKALLGVEEYLHTSGLEEKLQDLIKLRVSQINGCAYCIDMHWKDMRALGENEQRLYGLDFSAGYPCFLNLVHRGHAKMNRQEWRPTPVVFSET